MRKQKKKNNQKTNLLFTKLSSIIVLALLLVAFNFLFYKKPVVREASNHRAKTLSLMPTSKPQEPTPTPIKYSGYCLNVPVLLYHHVQPEAKASEKSQTQFSVDSGMFDLQMAYLISRGYTTISAGQLVDALINHLTLPPKSIVLTFDDGYKDMYDHVFPMLKKYNLVGNFMIPTGLVGGSDYMSWSQIEGIAKSGNMYFTDHTWSHVPLDRASMDKIRYEIETAKQQLEQHTGQTINLFTYPYGSFNDTVISVLQQNGFVGAFSTIPGFTQCDSFILNLHRNRVGNSNLSSYGL